MQQLDMSTLNILTLDSMNQHFLLSNFLVEIIEEPLFLEPEKEKEIILREIEDEINEFDEFLDLDYHSTNLAWNDDSFKHPITGDHKSVQGLTEKKSS